MATGSVTVLGAIYRVIIAREVGDAGYGQYYFVFTLAGMFVMFAGFGMRQAFTRAVAREPDRVGVLVAAGLCMRLVTGVASLLILYSLLPILNLESDITYWILIYGLICLPYIAIDVCEATFVAREVSYFTAITRVAGSIIKVIAGIWALKAGYGLTGVFSVVVISTSIVAVSDLWILKRYIPGVKRLWPPQRPEVSKLFLQSLPFVSLMITSRLYYRNDVFFLKWLRSDSEVGLYGAAYMPLDFLLMVATSVLTAAYPIVAAMHANEPERVQRAFAKLSRYGLLLTLPFSIILTFLGKPILTLVLGDNFARSADALKILCWATTIEVQVCLAGTFLGAMMMQNTLAKISVVSLLANVALNLLLIPRFGFQGAALSMVISASITWIINMVVMRKALSTSVLWDAISRPLLAAAVGIIVLLPLLQTGLILPIAAFMVAFSTIVLLTKATDGYERKILARLIRRRRVNT